MKRFVLAAVSGAAVLGSSLLVLTATGLVDGRAAQAQQPDRVAERLRTFDTLDFDVFSNQKWDRLAESHASDIVVTWPDGHETQGIARHIDDLKGMFVFAPDTKIQVHPIKFGSGDWTCVTGVDDRNLFASDADAGREDDRAHGKGIQRHDGHHRPLEGQRDGP